MRVARIIFPINVLGPGDRVGIWLAGCPHRCKGCSNPELWDPMRAQDISYNAVVEAVKNISGGNAFGITITGGEPFAQCEELYYLIKELRKLTDDILIYTGYTLEQLKESNNKFIFEILENISVIIDGKYIEEQNSVQPLIGSANQKIHYLDPKFEEIYCNYIDGLKGGPFVQNFASDSSIISVGIHSPNFNSDFEDHMKRRLS